MAAVSGQPSKVIILAVGAASAIYRELRPREVPSSSIEAG